MIRLIVVPGNNVIIGFQPYDLEKPFAGHVEQMGEQLQAQANLPHGQRADSPLRVRL